MSESKRLVVAEFGFPDALSRAARSARDQGFKPVDALTPCRLEEVEEALDLPTSPIRWPMLIAAVAIAASAYGLEYWSAVYAYPIDSGGRPLNSWQVFILVPFEVEILAAAIAGFVALLLLCGLPRLNHPLFEIEADRARDRRPLFPPVRSAARGRRGPAPSVAPDERESAATRGNRDMRPAFAVFAAAAVAGCTDQSMTRQPHYGPNAPAPAFSNGSAAQQPPAGTIAVEDAAYHREEINPPPVEAALLQRGKERFGIFCAPCHGYEGDGDGAIVRRGFPRPPSYYNAVLMQAPAQLFFNTITNGYGVMYPYGSRVPPHDRWAIVAYIRALQQSRSGTVAEGPKDLAAPVPLRGGTP